MKNTAFLFPGQGAQYVGMGKDFYDQFPEAKEVFQEADDILGESLSRLIFEGPSDSLILTKNSQRAIFVVSAALLRVLQRQLPEFVPNVCAGLSLGEYSALYAAKKMSFQDALLLVQSRALYMQQSCEAHVGTMRVVLGLQAEEVEEIVSQVQSKHQVWIANINCPGQIVISGTESGIEAASSALKEAGAKRVLPLEVSGAFHSGLMQDAQKKLTPKIEQVALSDSDIALVMNIPGGYVKSLADIRECLIRQVTGTVRWEQGIRSMLGASKEIASASETARKLPRIDDRKSVNIFVEIGCGKTFSGMNKKIGVASEAIFSLEKVTDLEILAGHHATVNS